MTIDPLDTADGDGGDGGSITGLDILDGGVNSCDWTEGIGVEDRTISSASAAMGRKLSADHSYQTRDLSVMRQRQT